MSSTVLIGYKAKVSKLYELEQILRDLKVKLKERATEGCRALLTQEIETLFDDISLNKIQRPESIFNAACNTLINRIQKASLRQLPVEYNFNISANILLNEDYIFLKINSTNFIFKEVFDSIPQLEEYSVDDTDVLFSNDTKSKRWTDLIKEYNDFQPIGINLLTGREDFLNDITPEELIFDSPENRVELLTRREMTTRLINMYANFEQIPPIKLTEYIDEALNRLDDPVIIQETDEVRKQLKTIIKPITAELIS